MDRPKPLQQTTAMLKGATFSAFNAMLAKLLATDMPMPGDAFGGSATGHRTGPGRVTVLTHERYIKDPRRKWYGLGGRRP